MARVSFSVNFKSNIPQVASALKPAVDEIERKVAHRILEVADQEVPVRTGRLRDSGDLAHEGDGYAVSYDVPYAVYVHNGTRHRPANPWLTRAVNRVQPEFQETFEDLEAFFERYSV